MRYFTRKLEFVSNILSVVGVKSLINKNSDNSRTSNNIDVKLRPLIKLNMRKTTTLKQLMMTLCQQIMMSLLFIAGLEQSTITHKIFETKSSFHVK